MDKLYKPLVICGPSGVGKTVLAKHLMKTTTFKDLLQFSVSSTTRAPRANETHGKDYHFVTKEEFDREIEKGKFLEFNHVHGNYYGTHIEAVNHIRETQKRICLLDIDVQGALNVIDYRQLQCNFVFI